MHYELWDTASRNLLYDFDSEDDARDAVRQLTVLNGSGTTQDLALLRVGDDGNSAMVALGSGLDAYLGEVGSEASRRSA